MKSKKPRSHILSLPPKAAIKEIDKVLKMFERAPKTPETMKMISNLQMDRARLKSEMSMLAGSHKN